MLASLLLLQWGKTQAYTVVNIIAIVETEKFLFSQPDMATVKKRRQNKAFQKQREGFL